jgi:hypothetical protein
VDHELIADILNSFIKLLLVSLGTRNQKITRDSQLDALTLACVTVHLQGGALQG